MGGRCIRLEADGHSYTLVSGRWAAEDSQLHALEPCRSERLLAEAMRGGDTRSLNRFLVDEHGLVALEEEHVLDRALHDLQIGRLVLLHEPRSRPSVDVTAPFATPLSNLSGYAADLAEPESPTEPDSTPQLETFVAFVLRDQDGNALAARAFTLEVPDGRTAEGTTDGEGRFRLDPVYTTGNCVVRFTESQSAA